MSEVNTKDIKYIENPEKFLVESGLLFEINRRILHPLGLALFIEEDEKGHYELGGILDCRSDPEGILYDETAFQAGHEKLNRFMAKFGDRKLQERYERLGFIVQGEE
jgi:hypothetical protein